MGILKQNTLVNIQDAGKVHFQKLFWTTPTY